MAARAQLKRKQASVPLHAKKVKICSGKALLDNYNNFSKSGIPARILYYRKGEWMDFPLETTAVLNKAFQGRKSVVEVVMAGLSYLVDFLHMMQIDLRSGWQTSIAWIDVNGKCFFPRVVSELNPPSQVDGRIEMNPSESGSVEESEGSSSSQSSECVSDEGCFHAGDGLIRLGEEEEEFAAVRERFLGGMRQLASLTSVVGIYRNSHRSVVGQSRLEAFKSHAKEMGRKCGGGANVKYAWHGSSKGGVAGILVHGFGQPPTPKNGAAYGHGVYLAPQHSSCISAAYSDVDENGEQHMVLCRVIMGNLEQVKPGSRQFHPSSEQFDTGVDDIQNPKRYIIWSTHMNTHILPEYVVSFKLPPQLHEYWSSVKANRYTIKGQGNPKHPFQDVQSASPKSISQRDGGGRSHPEVIQELPQASLPVVKQSHQSFPPLVKDSLNQMQGHTPIPTSAWMPFSMLLSVIGKFLSSSSIRLLKQHYADYKANKMNREDLIRRLRTIVGDRVLTSAIKMFQEQVPHMK